MSRPRKPINHGTIGGHRAHHRRGEPMCEPCRAANREARGNRPFQPSRCGTRGGYMVHMHRGDPPCSDCREAQNAYSREWRGRGLVDGDPRHGTENGYRNHGCRCEPCKAAGAVANRRAYEARRGSA